MDSVKYRIYADGTVLHEDDFDEVDHSSPYHDDYLEYTIPVVLRDNISNVSLQNNVTAENLVADLDFVLEEPYHEAALINGEVSYRGLLDAVNNAKALIKGVSSGASTLEIFRPMVKDWQSGRPVTKLCYGLTNAHMDALSKYFDA